MEHVPAQLLLSVSIYEIRRETLESVQLTFELGYSAGPITHSANTAVL